MNVLSSFITQRSSLITHFSGVLAVTQPGEDSPIFARAAGWADRSNRRRNRLDTRFPTASGCKLFTAVTFLRLVEEGRLALDIPVANYLPDFPFGPHITPYHLLTHTSGLPDYFDEDEAVDMDAYALLWTQRPVYTMYSACDFLPLFYTKTPKTLPGERFNYNNAGFLLLELLIERGAGVPFHEAVRRCVFEPAGMVDSGYFFADRLPARCALGYIPLEGGGWRSNIFAVPFIGGGDGGAYVTAWDWHHFWVALLNGKLLEAKIQAEMLRPQVATSPLPGRHYGLGVWLNTSPLPRAALALGGDPGVDMVSSCYLDRSLVLTVLSNVSDGAAAMFKAIKDKISLGEEA